MALVLACSQLPNPVGVWSVVSLVLVCLRPSSVVSCVPEYQSHSNWCLECTLKNHSQPGLASKRPVGHEISLVDQRGLHHCLECGVEYVLMSWLSHCLSVLVGPFLVAW